VIASLQAYNRRLLQWRETEASFCFYNLCSRWVWEHSAGHCLRARWRWLGRQRQNFLLRLG